MDQKRSKRKRIFDLQVEKYLWGEKKPVKTFALFRAMLNGPFVPRKPDIPIIEALRAMINIRKCQTVYRQYNFADLPLLKKNENKLIDPFVTNFLKWSPSREVDLDIQQRELEIMQNKVFETKGNKHLTNAMHSCFQAAQIESQIDDTEFLPMLEPFRLVVEKFKISKQVDEIIVNIKNELVLRPVQRQNLDLVLSPNQISQINNDSTLVYYTN